MLAFSVHISISPVTVEAFQFSRVEPVAQDGVGRCQGVSADANAVVDKVQPVEIQGRLRLGARFEPARRARAAGEEGTSKSRIRGRWEVPQWRWRRRVGGVPSRTHATAPPGQPRFDSLPTGILILQGLTRAAKSNSVPTPPSGVGLDGHRQPRG